MTTDWRIPHSVCRQLDDIVARRGGYGANAAVAAETYLMNLSYSWQTRGIPESEIIERLRQVSITLAERR